MLSAGIALFFLFFVVAAPAHAASSADFDNDGCVNTSDVTIFSGYFTTHNVAGDLNADAAVNVKDLALIMNAWQPTCVPTSTTKLKKIWQGNLGSSFDDNTLVFMAAHYDVIIIHFDKITAGVDPAYIAPRLARLKNFIQQSGRDVKVLAYYKFAGVHSSATDPAQAPYFAQSFLDQGLNWKDATGSPYQAENYWYFVDLQNAAHELAYKNMTVSYLRDLYSNYGLDGFFFDNAHIMTSGDTFTCKKISDGTPDPDPLCASATSHRVGGLPYNNDNAAVWSAKYDILKAVREDSVLANATIIANNFINKADFAATVPGHTRLEFYTNSSTGGVLANGILREEPFWQYSSNDTQGECFDKVNATLDAFASVPSTKSAVLYNYSTTRLGRIYSLAAALIVNNGNTLYMVGRLDAKAYSPEYDLDLGAPLGAATHPGGNTSLYVRDYAKGKVVMNTKALSCGSTTPATYSFDSTGYQYINDFSGSTSWPTPTGAIVWQPAASGTNSFTLDATHPAYVFMKP